MRLQPSTCNRPTFKELNRDLYQFGHEVRSALREAITACAATKVVGDEAGFVQAWGITLGVLMFDIAGSVLMLLSHGDRRGVALLNRSVFEYQMRLRHFIREPDKARKAMEQLEERFRVIMRADPTWRVGRTKDHIIETERWLDEKRPIRWDSFKAVMSAVVGEAQTQGYYDGYYGKASALAHGTELVLRDVLRDHMVGEPNPQIDYKGRVWSPNDAAAVLIYNLLDGLEAVAEIGGDTKASAMLETRWITVRNKVGVVVMEAS